MVIGATIAVAVPLSARAADDWPWPRGPVLTNSPELRASLARLSGSAAWRNALAALEATGRRAIVVTPDRVRVRDGTGKPDRAFDRDVIAEVQPLADGDSRVHLVIVVVNVPLLEEMHAASVRAEFEDDLDRILAHEVYGHAIPYLLAGDVSGKCADPLPGQQATESCAIKRENVIRNELRLGERREYGLDGLAIARRWR
jgi:hypothetical protein